jgi:hypothetical protein
MAGAQAARLRSVRGEIEYAIVALGLSAKELAEIIKDATGMPVNPGGTADDKQPTAWVHALEMSQLEATWKRLSSDPRWKKAK